VIIQQGLLPFKVEQTDELITPRSGLAFFAEVMRAFKIEEKVGCYFPEPGSNRGYEAWAYVGPLLLMLEGGGRHMEDLREIRDDGALRALTEVEEMPSVSTFGDWLVRTGSRGGVPAVKRIVEETAERIWKRLATWEYTLDVDATVIEAEKKEAEWTYKKVRGYQPLLGYLAENGVCLTHEFREGNVSPGVGHLAFYRACKARLPVGKRLARYRADSASYQAELINTLETDRVRWAITADQDVAVKAVIAGVPPEAWQEPEQGCGYQVAEAVHTMNQTKAAFRLSIKREERPQPDLFDAAATPYAYHVVASNWPAEEKTAHEVLGWHNQRGQAENFHKELKNGLGMEQMPCGESGANAVFFRIGVLAYNLFIGFKRLACPAAWAPQTIATVRWKLVQVAGRILRHAGQVVLRLVLDAEALACWRTIRQRCWALGVAT